MSSRYYNDIPDYLMSGEKRILEIGPASGKSQLQSNHRAFFLRNNDLENYLGFEVFDYAQFYLNIEKGDVRKIETLKRRVYSARFDLIIMMHVLEHILEEHWSRIANCLMGLVAEGGHLVIGVPYQEPFLTTALTHKVFNIEFERMEHYFPNAEIFKLKTEIPFAQDGASFLWAVLRYIKRRAIRDPSVRRYDRLLLIWSKERDTRRY